MSTPIRQLILEDIEATIASITIANGYDVDITTVSREKNTLEEVSQGEMPRTEIWKGTTPATHYPFGFAIRNWTIDLMNYCTEPDADEADLIVDLVRRSILDAMTRDRQRGGAAISTRLDDDYEAVAENAKAGQLRMRFLVELAEHDDGRDFVEMSHAILRLTAVGPMDWTTDDTAEKITNATTVGLVKDFTHATPNRLTYTGVLPRKFRVSFSVSQTLLTSATGVTYQIYKNGAALPESLASAGSEALGSHVSGEAFVELAQDDYLELWGESTNAAVDTQLDSFTLSAEEIVR